MWTAGLVLAGKISCDVITCDTYNGSEICYTVSDTSLNWTEAFDYCRNLSPTGGVIASVYSRQIQDRLSEVLSNVSTPVWIGGKTEDPRLLEGNLVSQWRWVYDCDRCDTLPKLEQFAVQSQGCYLDMAASPDLDVVVHESNSNISICISSCSGYNYAGLQNPQKCSCGDQFGKYGTISGCSLLCRDNCGGFGRNSVYRKQGQFSAWGHEQPDNGGATNGVHFCAVADLKDIFSTPLKYTYWDELCSNTLPYMCMFDGPCSGTIKPGSYYNTTFDKCLYVSSRNDSETWHRARTACWDMGADLVTVENGTQHLEIMEKARLTLLDAKVYIGLYREAIVWRRVHREVEMNYYNFDVGQPEFTRGRCLAVDPARNFTWRMSDCAIKQRTVCYQGPDMDPDPTIPWTTLTQTTDVNTPAVTDTTDLLPPNTDESRRGPLDRSTIITLAVLIPVMVILLVVFVVLMLKLCRKQQGTPERAKPNSKASSKDRIDARLQATHPQPSRIGEIEQGYLDMGSTAYLTYCTTKDVIPKTKRTWTRETEPPSPTPQSSVIRRNSNEIVLLPDFTICPFDLDGGRYEYGTSSTATVHNSAEGSQELLIPASYCSIPSLTDLPVTPTYTVESNNDLVSSVSRSNPPEVRAASRPDPAEVTAARRYDISPTGSATPLLDHMVPNLPDDKSLDGDGRNEMSDLDQQNGKDDEEADGGPSDKTSAFGRTDEERQANLNERPAKVDQPVLIRRGRIRNITGENHLMLNPYDMPPVV